MGAQEWVQDGAICQQRFVQMTDSLFSHFQMANTKEKEFVINNETLMDCIQDYRCKIMVHISFCKKYKANCSDEHTEIIIRHNHENDEKL